MKFATWLNESVSFTVRSWESNVPKSIYYLSTAIDDKLRQTFGKQYETGDFPDTYGKVTIDGFETDAKEGVLNFYSGGMDKELVKKALAAIQFYLKEMRSKLTGEIKVEKSGMFTKPGPRLRPGRPNKGIEVHRIPVAIMGREDRPPEVNISNDNAGVILQDILDIDDPQTGSMSPQELLDRLRRANQFAIDMSTQTAGWTGGKQQQQQQQQHYYGGLSEPQIQRHLANLKKLAEWAIQNHYDVIDWY